MEKLLEMAAAASVGVRVTGNIGGARPGTAISFSLEHSVTDEIRVQVEDENFKTMNEKRAKPIPALSEVVLEGERTSEKVGRLRSLLDR